MRKRPFLYGAGAILLAILTTLFVWQGSFAIPYVEPADATQTLVLWAVIVQIFLLAVLVGFMLMREGVKLFIARRSNVEGSRIKTKLIVGALALSSIPVAFMVVLSYYIVGHNIDKWFSIPADTVKKRLTEVSNAFDQEIALRAQSQAALIAQMPEMASVPRGAKIPNAGHLCIDRKLAEVGVRLANGRNITICSVRPAATDPNRLTRAEMKLGDATVWVSVRQSVDLAAQQHAIEDQISNYSQLSATKREQRSAYTLLMVLIGLFVLFVAIWIALFISKQISTPISALVEAAGQVRRGNFSYRIQTEAMDELGTLVRAFNDMSAGLQASEIELENRRNFTEAILESIPTGVISLSPARRIQSCNRALTQMFGPERVAAAARLEDLFALEDVKDIHYLLNRARRTGVAGAQIDMQQTDKPTLHLAVTASALVGKHTSGWVLVLEDTSEILRAQKSLAWHEVARRIAHELKNPLTPISLSSDRIARQIEKLANGPSVNTLPAEVMRVLRECSLTISGEVESVKTLVDEFAQFARFPAAQPALSDLNAIVESGLAVFQGRLDEIEVDKSLALILPEVLIDKEQFKRVVVNLIDNAAESMAESRERRLTVTTNLAGTEAVELVIADTGTGIAPEDRDRLFLPYFSTKSRGTGLGLAIVHHILDDHGAQIRVEDNQPHGSRFIIEIPVPQGAEAANRPVETVA